MFLYMFALIPSLFIIEINKLDAIDPNSAYFMTHMCDRCKREIYKYTKCSYCKRVICFDCVKSSQKGTRTQKLVICKDCWSNMKRRKAYRSKRSGTSTEPKA